MTPNINPVHVLVFVAVTLLLAVTWAIWRAERARAAAIKRLMEARARHEAQREELMRRSPRLMSNLANAEPNQRMIEMTAQSRRSPMDNPGIVNAHDLSPLSIYSPLHPLNQQNVAPEARCQPSPSYDSGSSSTSCSLSSTSDSGSSSSSTGSE